MSSTLEKVITALKTAGITKQDFEQRDPKGVALKYIEDYLAPEINQRISRLLTSTDLKPEEIFELHRSVVNYLNSVGYGQFRLNELEYYKKIYEKFGTIQDFEGQISNFEKCILKLNEKYQEKKEYIETQLYIALGRLGELLRAILRDTENTIKNLDEVVNVIKGKIEDVRSGKLSSGFDPDFSERWDKNKYAAESCFLKKFLPWFKKLQQIVVDDVVNNHPYVVFKNKEKAKFDEEIRLFQKYYDKWGASWWYSNIPFEISNSSMVYDEKIKVQQDNGYWKVADLSLNGNYVTINTVRINGEGNKYPYHNYCPLLINRVISYLYAAEFVYQQKQELKDLEKQHKEEENSIKKEINSLENILKLPELSQLDIFLRGRAPTYNPVTYKTHFDTWKKSALKEILSKLP